jgi:choline dehydrogenase-like flavoprotein
MDEIIVIGSGASGVHFALSALKKGYEVVMIDVGYRRPDTVLPDDSFIDLKNNLEDPVRYFCGEKFESVLFPDNESEYYGIPPSKNYVFRRPVTFREKSQGFEPLFSFAEGGLAEAWTAGVYPLNDRDLLEFPFDYSDMEPYYCEVAQRIGIMGEKDDLERYFPYHENILDPLEMDGHSRYLLREYQKNREYMHREIACYMGCSRVATLSKDKNGRKGCVYCGRCLWGCPHGSLYTPSITLRECLKFNNFRYVAGMYVSHLEYGRKHNITGVIAYSVVDGKSHKFYADRYVLAAGTLSSSQIFLNSIYFSEGDVIQLRGLLDNRQILVPFFNLRLIGKQYEAKTYQYHQVAMEIECQDFNDYIHCLITTLNTAQIHPILLSMPFDFKASSQLFRDMRSSLGILNVNFSDRRRETNYVSLEVDKRNKLVSMVTNYSPDKNEESKIKYALRKVKKALFRLKCIAPTQTIYVRPSGASVHYAGTIPMSDRKSDFTTSSTCRSYDFSNLFIVDGSTFPYLPPKDITFTLMANAVRVADTEF